MKTIAILLLISFSTINYFAQCTDDLAKENSSTTIGIVLYSNDAETVWNAIRFANFAKNKGDTVTVFLLGKGVELDYLVGIEKDLKVQVETFFEKGGEILGCGTCLQSRNNENPKICKFSSMSELYELVRKNKIVLTF